MEESPIINALTVDVEDYFHVAAFDQVVKVTDWDRMESRVEQNTNRVLELFADHGVSGTFFVLGVVAERHPGLVREIVAAGHELACHGYSHQKIYTQEPKVFREETRRAKTVLEDTAGVSVKGYRGASFSVTAESLWALDVLVEEGFAYDSSIFPVHHDNYGIPGADRAPHVIATPAGAEIAEIPLSTVSIAGLPVPVGGGGYFRLYPYGLSRLLMHRINRADLPFVFYCHPWEFDPEQPRIKGASLLSRFRHYNNLRQFEPRLRKMLKEFRLGTCRELLEQVGVDAKPGLIPVQEPSLP